MISLGIGILELLLRPLENELGDLQIGFATGYQVIEPPLIDGVPGGIIEDACDDSGDCEVVPTTGEFRASLRVSALRVPGVTAESELGGYISMYLLDPLSLELDLVMAWREVDGRRLLIATIEDEPGWTIFYPKGEVMFVGSNAGQVGVTIDDLLAELP